MTTSPTSTRPSAQDRLRSLYSSPGPYTSIYLAFGEFAAEDPQAVFNKRRADLASKGSSPRALEAIEARLTLPRPDDVAGMALHAADDGSTTVDYALEGPSVPIIHVGTLPVAAPLLEWDQWRVPHVVVSFGADTAEVVTFLPNAEPAIAPLATDPIAAAAAVRELAVDDHLRLVVVVDQGGEAKELARGLRGVVPLFTNVIEIEHAASLSLDEVVDTTVRYVSDVVARDTVRVLELFRTLTPSGHGVEGTAVVFDALAAGRVKTLLVHDDPNDPTTVGFDSPPSVCAWAEADAPLLARRIDAAIWSAVQQGAEIRIIPDTSSTGPKDNIGAVLRTATDERDEGPEQ